MTVDKENMDVHFAHLQMNRNNVLNVMKDLNESDLNYIPQGFNNNIIWNATHLLTTQQYFCYYLSGLHSEISGEMVKRYARGTKPEGNAGADEIKFLKEQLEQSVGRMREDFAAGKFVEYKGMDLGPNFKLSNIQEALSFNNTHESLHLGYMMALKRSL